MLARNFVYHKGFHLSRSWADISNLIRPQNQTPDHSRSPIKWNDKWSDIQTKGLKTSGINNKSQKTLSFNITNYFHGLGKSVYSSYYF